jgi:N-acetylmuramoyl-L-alanine amidase
VAEEYFPEWRIRKDESDGDSDKESDFTILTKTNCPAILTENFFMDTQKDCKFILSDEGREKIADMHVSAILRYKDELDYI